MRHRIPRMMLDRGLLAAMAMSAMLCAPLGGGFTRNQPPFPDVEGVRHGLFKFVKQLHTDAVAAAKRWN